MNWPFFPESPAPLGVDSETAGKILAAMKDGKLLDFAKKHPLTPAHFLVLYPSDPSSRNTLSAILARTPLHTAAVRGTLDQVAAALQLSGEHLLLEHFLIKDRQGLTPLHSAVWCGHLDQVVEALKPSGQKLTAKALLTGKHSFSDKTPLDYAVQENRLNQVFTPSLWAGRVNEMVELWKHVPENARGQIDYDAVVTAAIRESLPPVPRWNADAYADAVHSPASVAEMGRLPQGKSRGS